MTWRLFLAATTLVGTTYAQQQPPWERYRGHPGSTGWRCNVIAADPDNQGPDGINLHDWDGDGDLDVFSNAEEGKYSRLYFNPGADKVRAYWTDFTEFKHGKCEDSGIGDLDDDGDIDDDGDLDILTTEENGGWGVIWFENPLNNSVVDR